ncbi:MAG TPA: hypothetical protein DDW52_20465 [Planctomycetaceae bacterium]|nr:hypothetical protein [Planctomycetaceae bacterium]
MMTRWTRKLVIRIAALGGVSTELPTLIGCFAVLVGITPWASNVTAADPADARAAFYSGQYEKCIELCRAEVERGVWNVFWSKQLAKCLNTTGKFAETVELYQTQVERFPSSLRLRMLAAEAYRFAGESAQGNRLLEEIPYLVQSNSWRFRDAENLLAIGEYSLEAGEDARDVLAFYDAILERDPKAVDAQIATARLAIAKADYQEAVRALEPATELRPEDPEIRYLLAVSWAPSDAEKAEAALRKALELNPRHIPSLLEVAERLAASEKYEESDAQVSQVLDIAPLHPRAWALRAAICHLRGDYTGEAECRAKALSTWQTNPSVDYWIGEQLSQHYRFAESVTYQRRALTFDPAFLPAKFQLAQDLLRLGKTDEGWRLVESVAENDKYNVVAFNLKTLKRRLDSFATLRQDGIIVRMDSDEARIYGERVLKLLSQAREVLSEKYDVELQLPITVEIFPEQGDFAIRTFGLPGGAGFLGVCFGSLITANSPASQGEAPSNWESVLWHEFCHVVTLQKTNNKMPRWLSEGISVYEELQRDPTWGQSITPAYKSMLLGDAFVPLSELSGAFLAPESPLALQFAYYESALAVRFLIESQGLEKLKRTLTDMGVGLPPKEAIERNFGSLEYLDAEFKAFVVEYATAYAPDVVFPAKEIPEGMDSGGLRVFISDFPNNYAARQLRTLELLRKEEYSAAKQSAEEMIDLFADDYTPTGGHALLARIHRELNDAEQEAAALEIIANNTSDDVGTLRRLIDLKKQAEDWESVQLWADRLLAVNPLLPVGHQASRDAAVALGELGKTIEPLKALQVLQPGDPALLHYQIASAMQGAGRLEEARIEVLNALAESPRYREAQRLLVSLRTQLDAPAHSDVRLPVASPLDWPAPAPEELRDAPNLDEAGTR